MFSSRALLLSILIYLTVVGASPFARRTGKATLSLATTRWMKRGDTFNIAEKDRARAHDHKRVGHLGKRDASESITDATFVYTTEVGVGNPATNYTLVIDTGSSSTWVKASKPYVQTSTSINTGNNVSVRYGSGNFSGEEWLDTVTVAASLAITDQSIGVASSESGFNQFDGILGLGPVDLTNHTVSNKGTVPTVLNNLFSQGTINNEVLGVYFVPASEPNNAGVLTFGGYDDSVVTSAVNYVPLTTTFPASKYWGIDQSISYDGTTILSLTAGIVDTGTTLILLASDAFRAYANATGGTLDATTGLLVITDQQYSNLKTLSFYIGSVVYDLSPNAQIWPRSLNTALGGNSTLIYLAVSDLGNQSKSGFGFVNGYTFLQRYYSIFDTTNQRVGFASTAYTSATTN